MPPCRSSTIDTTNAHSAATQPVNNHSLYNTDQPGHCEPLANLRICLQTAFDLLAIVFVTVRRLYIIYIVLTATDKIRRSELK